MLNKAKHKTRCRCMREEEEGDRSSYGDNTNVLTKEFETFTVKRFGKQISLLIISVNDICMFQHSKSAMSKSLT